jgi:NADH-quinone oxidoreductase subunit A
MLGEYLGVLVILALAVGLASAMLAIHLRVGPRRSFPAKQEPFECGESPISSPRQRFSVKFYLVAILFVVFDLEAIYFYPWGATFLETGIPGLVAIGLFTVPLVVGLAYEWMKGALEW